MCHMSRVTCHVSGVTIFFGQRGQVLSSMGPTSSSFRLFTIFGCVTSVKFNTNDKISQMNRLYLLMYVFK